MYNINDVKLDNKQTKEIFWKLASNDRFPKLKDFALKMHLTLGSTCVCESTFSTMKQAKSKYRGRMAHWTTAYETLDRTKHWTIVSELLQLTLVFIKE